MAQSNRTDDWHSLSPSPPLQFKGAYASMRTGESPNRVVLSVVGIVPAEIAVVLVLILILILVS
jgi:hypothetical protein